jgi:YihY family inner membrane protein
MSTASAVPVTRGELEGDEALETLRDAGRRRLLLDTVARFRAADGFSHARALAFNVTLTILPALLALVGLAAALETDELRRVLQALIDEAAPGPAGDVLSQALREGDRRGGVTAVAFGAVATLAAATTTMAQVERSANRLYGVERDRPFVARYGRAFVLAVIAGGLLSAAVALLVGGQAIREEVGFGETGATVWRLLRYPLGLMFVVASVALLFEASPRRRQPEASWLAVGAALAAGLWVVFMVALDGWFGLTGSVGGTYGVLAGVVGVLVWAFLTSLALLLGLAFAAQLEAVRAGVREPRVERHHND